MRDSLLTYPGEVSNSVHTAVYLLHHLSKGQYVRSWAAYLPFRKCVNQRKCEMPCLVYIHSPERYQTQYTRYSTYFIISPRGNMCVVELLTCHFANALTNANARHPARIAQRGAKLSTHVSLPILLHLSKGQCVRSLAACLHAVSQMR